MKTSLLSIIGKASAIVALKVMTYTLFALLLNIIIIVSHWRDIIGSESGLMGYLSVFLCMIFVFLFFILGQKQGVMAAVCYIIENRKATLITYLVTMFAKKFPDVMNGNTAQASNINKLSEYLDKVPSVMVTVLEFFLTRISLVDTLLEAVKTANEMELTGEARLEKVSHIITEEAEVDAFSPSLLFPILLLVLNLGVFFI